MPLLKKIFHFTGAGVVMGTLAGLYHRYGAGNYLSNKTQKIAESGLENLAQVEFSQQAIDDAVGMTFIYAGEARIISRQLGYALGLCATYLNNFSKAFNPSQHPDWDVPKLLGSLVGEAPPLIVAALGGLAIGKLLYRQRPQP